MNITEHEMRGLITGKAMPADIFVGESLAAYLVRKFAVLQKERDALAVLAEERRQFIVNGVEMGDILFPAIDGDPAIGIHERCLLKPKFAYDAYLNSVRADVIKQLHSEQKEWALVTWQYDSFDALKRAAVRHGDSELSGVIFMLDRIEGFAAQIRAGEPS